MAAWGNSYYFTKEPIQGSPWVLQVEFPVAPMQSQFYVENSWTLTLLAVVFAMALGIATIISRIVTQPILSLADISKDLPAKIKNRESIHWPATNSLELLVLVNNFNVTAEALTSHIADIHQREEEICLKLISASGYRDEETGSHIQRIGLFGAILAQRIGWDQERVDYMRVAGAMHDVGKIGIPDEILHKPGKLTTQEFEIMAEHTIIGKKILQGTKIPPIQMATDIAEYHHEKWNGSGYPYGIKGSAIPESAQIVALVDVYDALSNDRVYRAALPEEKVLSIMEEGNNNHFNPFIYDAFIEVLPAFRKILSEHEDKIEELDRYAETTSSHH